LTRMPRAVAVAVVAMTVLCAYVGAVIRW